MSLHVVAAACTFSSDRGNGTVIVESDIVDVFPNAIEELQSTQARTLALGHAAQHGMGDPRINGSVGFPYPINDEGVELNSVTGPDGAPLPPNHPRKQIARYRVDVPVTRRLV